MSADTLVNAERPAHDRPHAVPPILPDLESSSAHWLGPASAWKTRALRAETLVREMRRELAKYRRP